MTRFIVHRLAQSIITVFIVSVIVFAFMNLAGDPVVFLLPPEATARDVAMLRHELGLDRPAQVRYLEFMGKFWYSDTVKSFRYHDRLLPLILSHLRWTLVLAGAALSIAVALAIPLGTIGAQYQGKLVDVTIRFIAVLGESLPSFSAAILLMFILAVKFPILPVAGLGVKNAILPVATLALSQVAVLMRLFRAELLEVLSQDYVRTARAKGLLQRVILTRHVFRNAAIPMLSMAGLLLNLLVLGAVVVEPIFAWPGLGWLIIQSVLAHDFPVVVGGALISAVLVSLVNITVDILYAWLDPRIRLS